MAASEIPSLSKVGADCKPGRGRPRSEHSHEAILDAVLRLLEAEGYDALTIEGVARQAGVGKQTIYRWWKCKAELVLEAYANHAASKTPVPDRGSLRADLEAFLGVAFKRLTDISGPIMRGLMADAVHDDEFREVLVSAFVAKRHDALRQIFQRGMERGEVDLAADIDLACELILGPLWYRLLLQQGKLDARFARQLTTALLAIVCVRADSSCERIEPVAVRA
ncbi:MAG: TetR/AcrR family transcriptional regulator [Burkholderiales bacterium]|nr:TetR/AcrR family transcriptional regulator [Burkholderiales bacterium]